jgi:hypothetical protein
VALKKLGVDPTVGFLPALCGVHQMVQVSSLTYSLDTTLAQCCSHSRKAKIIADFGMQKHDTYESCAQAEYEAFVDRHLEEFLSISDNFKGFMIDHTWPDLVPMTDEELINSRPSRMRKKYIQGLEKELDKSSANVRMFVKNEHMKLWEGRKPPRAIQYRGATYTANLAKFCVPLEHYLAWEPMDDNHGFPMTTKGRNSFELAQLITDAYYMSSGDIYLVDHSAYDAHQGPHHQYLERVIFSKCFPGYDEVTHLLKMQRRNKVYSAHGLRVKCIARRMSGDANTSVGNSIINYIMLRYIFGSAAIIMVNGDDSVVYSPNPPLHEFLEVGMVTKWSVVHFIEDIEYCQMRPVLGSNGWAMVKNPERVLSRKQTKLSPIDVDTWLRVVGIGERYSSPYDPISQAICQGFLKRSKSTKWNSLALSYQCKEMGKGIKEVYAYDEACSQSYANAWGLTMADIKRLVPMITAWAATSVDGRSTQSQPSRISFH